MATKNKIQGGDGTIIETNTPTPPPPVADSVKEGEPSEQSKTDDELKQDQINSIKEGEQQPPVIKVPEITTQGNTPTPPPPVVTNEPVNVPKDHIKAVRGAQTNVFTQAEWIGLGADKAGWVEAVERPEEIK